MRFARPFLCLLSALAALLTSSGRVLAQPAYADEDTRQTVARVAYVDGPVAFSRGDDPEDWQTAVRNAPMTIGDRIYTAEGRAELQVHGADFIRLSRNTDLAALNLTEEIKQFSLTSGTASFSVRHLRPGETFEVDTPNAAVTFERSGYYRVDVDQEGSTRVLVRRGEALVAAAGGQVPLAEGSEMRIEGIDEPTYDVYAIPRPDSWDRWVDFREARIERSPSYRYVNAEIVGVDDLDEYGAWEDIPEYGHSWTPSRVAAGWQPYIDGHWIWQDPWGWTWVAEEPWGWAPYHYGRWVDYRSRWYWVPAGPSVRVAYAPAMVAFVGGGPGSFGAGRGYVGWFPLGPRDPFVPWWGARARTTVNVTNVTYVNQRFVTVVNPNTFTSGASVRASIIRDPGVVRQIVTAPVIRGALAIVPTASSLRMAPRSNAPALPRPPVAISARPVVTRLAVPPAPPRFDQKVAAIQENRGAPLPPAQAARIAVQNQGARSVAPVRPVATPQGGVMFVPKRPENASAPRPQPVTAPPGKALATPQRPTNPNAEPPARIAPGAVAPPVRQVPPGPAPRPEPPAARPAPQQDRSSPPGQPSTYTRPPRNVPPPRTETAPPPRPAPAPPAREAAPPPRNVPPPRAVPAPQPSTYTRPPADRNAPPPPKSEKEKKDKEKRDKEKKDKEKQPPPPQ
jgi:hypothetical protein